MVRSVEYYQALGFEIVCAVCEDAVALYRELEAVP
jgi:hypothetical protein